MMSDLHFEEQKRIQKDIDARYRQYISEQILIRLQLILSIGIILHLAFTIIDHLVYPSIASAIYNIRLIDSLGIFIVICLSFFRNLKPHIHWLSDAAGSIFVIGMCVMILITDGSSNRYYEGANLVFLGMSIINPFYIGHLIVDFLIWIGLNDFAMLSVHGKFNMLNFTFANYFMSSTALLVIIMTKFYKDQHYKAFVRQEQLKINEETLAALYAQADKLSKTDTLTEINNRRHFSDMLQKKMESCEAAKSSFYLVIFDVDHFKGINDTYGHAFGDKVLLNVVEIVKNNVRSNDFIGRFGGDEFVICLDFPDKEKLLGRLTKISSGVRNLGLTFEDKQVAVSVSIGAAKFIPGIGMNEEKLLEKADFELFNVKKTTRGQISVNE